jgi:hypothetical protein
MLLLHEDDFEEEKEDSDSIPCSGGVGEVEAGVLATW